jgi:predicted  nucleic acid-binding Zn-ribbon protein
MIRAEHSRELGVALSRLADVEKEIHRCESDEQSIERGLEPLRRRLEQMSMALERRRGGGKAAAAAEAVPLAGGVGRTSSARDEVSPCRYRELLEELEEKTAIARSTRRLAQRERRVLEIRRSHILAAIPPEILAAYDGLMKAAV